MGEEESKDQAADEELMRRLQEELQNMTVSDHLLYMMHSLSALALGRMGLTADIAGRRDLEQARLAIDAFKALAGLVERERPAEEMAVHRSMLSQLQLSYVGALDAGDSKEAPGDRPAESQPAPDDEPAPDNEPAPDGEPTPDDQPGDDQPGDDQPEDDQPRDDQPGDED
jgi:hypothetical protein